MIVDCHTHVWERPVHLSDGFIADARAVAGESYQNIAVDLEKHWEAMQPVDRAIVLGFRARHVGVLVPNEYVAAYVRRHPEKLIGFCSVDPTDPDAVAQLQYAVKTLGLRGLKLGPIYQNVHPSDTRFKEVLQAAEQLDIPVLLHQGTTFCSNVTLEVASPVLLEPLALAFPRLRMVIAHLGHPWISETVVMIRKHRNLYSDISALHYRPWQFYNALVTAMEYGVLQKLLFGSDYPFSTPAATMQDLRNLNQIVEHTALPKLPLDQLEGLIQRDTLRLLGIDG